MNPGRTGSKFTGSNRCRASEIIEWDVATWSRALPVWEAAVGASLARKKGLEIGARGGGLSLWMAQKGGEVVCSYHGEDMARAQALHQAHGVTDRVRYEALDATAMPYKEHFDLIMLKSVIGGIGAGDRPDRQRQAIRQIHQALKTGGLFLFAENVLGSPLHRLVRRIKRGDRWRYLGIDELGSMLGDFEEVTYTTTGFLALFGLTEGQRRLLGRLDERLCPRVPRSWHYVMIGVARK